MRIYLTGQEIYGMLVKYSPKYIGHNFKTYNKYSVLMKWDKYQSRYVPIDGTIQEE